MFCPVKELALSGDSCEINILQLVYQRNTFKEFSQISNMLMNFSSDVARKKYSQFFLSTPSQELIKRIRKGDFVATMFSACRQKYRWLLIARKISKRHINYVANWLIHSWSFVKLLQCKPLSNVCRFNYNINWFMTKISLAVMTYNIYNVFFYQFDI